MEQSTSTTRWWSAYARIYDLLWSGPVTDRLADAVLEHCGEPRWPLIDVGCGTGLLSARLVAHDHDVICVDANAEMLRRLTARIPGAYAVAGTVTDMPIRPGSAHIVVATNLLHLHSRPSNALTALAALLAPSGRLICSWPRADSGPWRVAKAEWAQGIPLTMVLARSVGRIAIGVSAPRSMRRTSSADLIEAVTSLARRLRTPVRWIDLPEAEQTLAVLRIPARRHP